MTFWHCRAFTVPGAVCGLSPVQYARESIGLGLAAEQYGGRFFGDNATPAEVLTCETNLTGKQAERMLRMWRLRHQGHRGVALLAGGVDFKPISINPDESQFREAQRFNVTQIARIFGVPPEMVGGDAGNSLTYANTESRALDYLRYSINPWIVRLEAALSTLLPATHRARFNVNALLRPTTAERYAAHEVALRAGFLTVDEVRALEDLPPLPPREVPS